MTVSLNSSPAKGWAIRDDRESGELQCPQCLVIHDFGVDRQPQPSRASHKARDHRGRDVNSCDGALFLAREIFELEKCKLDRRPPGFDVPYRFYVGIKTEFFDSIEQKRAFDSLGEDLGGC